MTFIESTFKKGPKIKVHVTLEKQLIQSILLLGEDSIFTVKVFSEEKNYPLVETILNWFYLYSKKKKPNILPIDLSHVTPFENKVYCILRDTQPSETFAYKEIAKKIGHPKAYRAVGNACNKNKFILYIPCHRVLRSNGKLGGFALSTKIKEKLLAFESSS